MDTSGAKAVTYEYSAWGTLIGNSTSGTNGSKLNQYNAMKYRGYYYDADLAMYYLGSRFYDTEICRFINADSLIIGDDRLFGGYNMYAYCYNNPVNLSDESGNLPVWAWIAIGAAVVTVANHIVNAYNKSKINKELEDEYTQAEAIEEGNAIVKKYSEECAVTFENTSYEVKKCYEVTSRYNRQKVATIAKRTGTTGRTVGKMRKYFQCLQIVGIIVLFITILVVSMRKISNQFQLKDLISETEEIPAYSVYGGLFFRNKMYYIEEFLEKKNLSYDVDEVLCVHNQQIYFVSVESDKWHLVCVDMDELIVKTVASLEHVKDTYVEDFSVGYKLRNGFAIDGKIVLNDFERVLEYVIDSDEYKICQYDEYEFPEYNLPGTVIDSNTIQFGDDVTQDFSLEKMAQRSNAIAQIYSKHDLTINAGISPLSHFFSKHSMQIVNGKLYAIGQYYDYWGHAEMILLEYNHEQQRWVYVTKHETPMGDKVHGRCYVVPIFQ